MKKLLLLTLCIAFAVSATAQPYIRKGLEAITLRSSKAQLELLASDELQGRLAGSAHNSIVSKYLFSVLSEMGYEPVFQEFEVKGKTMRNILVTIPGRDTSQVVMLGAHYDHLGVDPQGDVYNGADDNASGAVAILQIAKALRVAAKQPQRTMILALWDCEEWGLKGSRHFISTFANLSKIKSYINFDMIGRNTDESRPRMFRYFYTESSPEFGQWMRDFIVKYKLPLEPDYRPWDKPTSGSDNASFARAGIPIVWYHTDANPDFHKPSDTADKINWDKMVAITRSAYLLFWQTAN